MAVNRVLVRVVGALVLVAAGPTALHAQPVPPVRLSVATDGTQGNAASSMVAVSADGRQVLFTSAASNLVPGDTNGVSDLFVRDRDTDRDGILDEPGAVATRRMSEGPAGQQITADNQLSGWWMSTDGRFVFFNTASALSADDTNAAADGYMRDRDTDGDGIFDEPGAILVTRVTTAVGNTQLTDGGTIDEVTPDGRYVLFFSRSTTLHPPPLEAPIGYRKDLRTSGVVPVTTLPNGMPPNAAVTGAVMSPDGAFVAFSGGFVPPAPVPAGVYWILREVVTGSVDLIVAPTPTGSTLPLIASYQTPVGFSADSSRLLLASTVFTLIVPVVRYTGTWDQYQVVTRQMVRAQSGVPEALYASELGRGLNPTLGFAFTPFADNESCSVPEGYGRFFFDRRTNRIRQLTNGRVGLPTSSADGRRVLYLGGECQPGSPQSTYLWDAAYDTPLPMPAPVFPGQMDAAGTMTIFSSDAADILAPGTDTNDARDVFAVDLVSRLDRDNDGLDDRWEIAMGLDYTSAAGNDGAAGDPDADGVTNAQELAGGTHPRGTARQFLAEGADNVFFKTRLAIANPGAAAATAVVRLDGDDGTAKTVNVHVPAGARRTVLVDEIAGHAAEFATVVDSSVPLVAERTMSWGPFEQYGAHAERASAAPSTSWYLAEGSTGGFLLFYLFHNPGDTAATATVRYLRPAPLPPIDRTYALPARTRVTVGVHAEPGLASTDVSASITATVPIFVERAMYRNVGTQTLAAGHASAGVTGPATSWFLAEGATGDFFDLFVLIANPTTTTADVEVRYLLTTGEVLTKSYTVAAESRRTIYVDAETFPGRGQALVNTTLSCAITSSNAVPIVVERSMWFPGPAVTPLFWSEAHNSPGTTTTATRWVLADGESGGTRDTQTFVLIANTSGTAGRVRLTQLPDAPPPFDPALGTPITITLDLPANSRTTVPLHLDSRFTSRRYGVIVESIDTAPLAQLVVERAMYWNADGAVWAAGTNLLATPVP